MATVQEAVRRLRVEFTAKGEAETTRALTNVGQAHKGVTVELQKSERATVSMEKRLHSIQSQYDKNYRATSAMAKITRDLNAIEAQGLITTARKNELLAMAAARHGQAATATGLHTRALAGLSAMAASTAAVIKSMLLPLAAILGPAALIRTFVTNSIQAEDVMAQLEARIRATGGAAGYTAKELSDLASATQRVTTYDDEAVVSAQTMLLTYTKIGRETFPKALEATLDLATGLRMDLTQAARTVGLSMESPTLGMTRLTRAGVVFTDSQKATIKSLVESGRLVEAQTILYDALQRKFGGAAEAARGTLGGALKSLSNAWGDLFEVTDTGSSGLTKSINGVTDLLQDPGTISAIQGYGAALFDAFAMGITGARALMAEMAENHRQTAAYMDAIAQWREGTMSLGETVSVFMDPRAHMRKMSAIKQSSDWWSNATKLTLSPPAVLGETGGSGTGSRTEDQTKQWARATQSIERQIEAMRIQAATFGMTEQAAARYRIEQQLLNAAKEAGIKLGPTERSNIAALSETYAAQAEQLERMRERYEMIENVARTVTGNMGRAFDDFIETGKINFRGFVDSLLKDLARLAIQEMVLAPLTKGLTGSLGSLFGASVMHEGGIAGYGAASRYVHPAYFDDAPRFHSGKRPWGPNEIPALLERGEEVLTRRDPRHSWNGGGRGGGTSVMQTVNNTFNSGMTPTDRAWIEARLSQAQSKTLEAVREMMIKGRAADPGYYGY